MNDKREYYEFTWPGKRQAKIEAGKPATGALRPCRELSKNFESTQNLYIEGDNLEVLKILRRSYMHKVKMIYIDPPYNTGHDFIYKDSFAQDGEEAADDFGLFSDEGEMYFTREHYRENTKSNPRYHSDWCGMIYPRLKVARDLLRDDGVIFISIDDNEVANLRKMCDEIFGEDNFRNQIVIRRGAKSVQAQFDTWDKLGRDFEYILLYTRNAHYRFPQQLKPLEDAREGSWNNHWRGTNRPTMRYSLLGITPNSGQWRWSEERSSIAIENYKRMLNDVGTKTPTQSQIDDWYNAQPDEPDLLRLSSSGKPEHYIPPAKTTLLNSSWMDLLIGSSSEVNALFNAKIFDTPKLTAPIKRMLRFTSKDAIILDFFSGSATTAHAVMALNHEDGGTRKFIMVQLPEECSPNSEARKAGYMTICDIGRERIRRAGENLSGDTGFRVLRLDSSNFRDVYVLPEELTVEMLDDMVENIKPDRTGEDLLFYAVSELGLPLSLSYREETINGFTVYVYGDGEIVACFDECISKEVVVEMAKMKPLRIVFRDSCFADGAAKINAIQLVEGYAPDAIIRVL